MRFGACVVLTYCFIQDLGVTSYRYDALTQLLHCIQTMPICCDEPRVAQCPPAAAFAVRARASSIPVPDAKQQVDPASLNFESSRRAKFAQVSARSKSVNSQLTPGGYFWVGS